MIVSRGSTAVLRDNILVGGGPIGIFDGSSPLVEGNTLTDGPNILGGPGDGTLIRSNTIRGAKVRAIGLAEIHGTSPTDRVGTVTIEGNVIENAGSEGIDARSGTIRIVGNTITGGEIGINTGPTARAHIEGNTVAGAAGTAISTEAAADVRIERNDLIDNRIAVSMRGGSVRDNSLSGNELGINLNGSAEVAGNRIVDGGTGLGANMGTPAITDNEITGNDLGVLVIVGSNPVLSGNTICDNDRNLVVPDGAQPPDTAANEICADLTEEQAS